MRTARKAKSARPRRRLTKPSNSLAQPLDVLVFLLPLLLAYEVGSFFIEPASALERRDRVVAFHLLRQTLAWFGSSAIWLPAVAIATILICTHVASRRPWRVNPAGVLWMYVESLLLALPLLVATQLAPLAATFFRSPESAEIVLGIGAGIYEELVFRLILVSLLVMLGVDLLKLPLGVTATFAVMFSATLFAAHHHPPLGGEPFAAGRFLFRFLAGAYLGGIFYFRGYGPAAGTHAAYNFMASLLTM